MTRRYDTITPTITRLDIYGGGGGETLHLDTILFTEYDRAVAVRDELLADDGLAGVDRIEIMTGIPTDERALDAFYERVMAYEMPAPYTPPPCLVCGAYGDHDPGCAIGGTR